jgi:hypothetical protein
MAIGRESRESWQIAHLSDDARNLLVEVYRQPIQTDRRVSKLASELEAHFNILKAQIVDRKIPSDVRECFHSLSGKDELKDNAASFGSQDIFLYLLYPPRLGFHSAVNPGGKSTCE